MNYSLSTLISLGLILSFFVLGASYAADTISPEELSSRIAQGDPPFILDVRTPGEFNQGHIQGAVNIPVADIAKRAAELEALKSEEVVVYCQMGPRAGFATAVLEQVGFVGIRDLDGHMHRWVESGLTVVKLQ